MTEQEWLASDDPAAMLEALPRRNHIPQAKGPPWPAVASDRRLRLFACGCCRLVWDRLTDECSRRAVEVAERYADGLATLTEMREVRRGLGGPVRFACMNSAAGGARFMHQGHGDCPPPAAQAALLRDIFGSPRRAYYWTDDDSPKKSLPHYLPHEWRTSTVLALARAARDSREGRECGRCESAGEEESYCHHLTGAMAPCPDCGGPGRIGVGLLDPTRLVILADALEEAGCTEEAVLQHLRGWAPTVCRRREGLGECSVEDLDGRTYHRGDCSRCPATGFVWGPSASPHVRGCWVLDLLLGKT